ncbi:uncharacterized protein DNG_00579 [Cephalotrichum gorgonifer]|uniref:PNPLA domain-containing protein n=1 Tax=Cephalotrichum gorgonifer TaxID=2041049 RepID=A0AAE8MR25_9PEZI|nr:uncharacterized protein DNG_00579 [Cephalotrichum gorgonifer]
MDIATHEFSDPNEPVYLLSLDGGGVRGISEAVILHEIMTRIQKELALPCLPRPCDYFHLIGGTSTGGHVCCIFICLGGNVNSANVTSSLIAIMLGRLRMTTREVIDEYEAISETIFRRKNRRFDRTYKEDKLVEAINKVAGSRTENLAMAEPEDDTRKGRSFVVSVRKEIDENIPFLFRSYKCQGQTTKCQLWEAARATTAAPGFFTTARVKMGNEYQTFVDGAVKWNNPSRQVMSEAEALFGPHRRLGCMLSLGSGVRPPSLNQNAKASFGVSYNISEMKRMTLDYLTDPEPPHLILKALLKGHTNSYFRFSVPAEDGEERIRINEYKKMGALRASTERYLARRDISAMIDQLVQVICRKEATNLTLEAVCHANSAETSLKSIAHELQKREITSPTFTGRENILKILDHTFARRAPGSYPRRDFRLWGATGMGKTQIALRFTEMFRDRFTRVFWIDASEASTIYHSFENIASEVLPNSDKGPKILPVIRWLENTQEEWLLVVDNYDDGDMTRFLPGYGKGNVLFTSRRFDLPPQAPPESTYHVFEMSMEESTLLLLRSCRRQPSEELETQSKPLIEELGSLPLAIDQAGAYIRMTGCSFDQYIAKVRDERKSHFSEAPHTGDQAGGKAVYATFELSWDCLKSYARGSSEHAASSQSALQILNTFCFYHSQRIPIEILPRARGSMNLMRRWGDIGLAPVRPVKEKFPTNLAEGTDAAWIDTDIVLGIRHGEDADFDPRFVMNGVMILLQFSLLTQVGTEALYSIHPLMHSWLRDRMTPGTFDRSLRVARSIIYHSYHESFQDPLSEQFYPSLLPHMKANNSHQFKGGYETPFKVRMENDWKYTKILQKSHLWEEAIPVIEQDIKAWVYELDRNDWRTLDAMFDLGKAYMATGRMADAEDVLLQVLDRTSYCANQARGRKRYIHTCGELSMVYLVQGNIVMAQGMAETANKYAKVREDNSLVAMTRLCLVYQYVERWEEAAELARAVLDKRMEIRRQGLEHPLTLKAEAELACIRARLGETDAAEAVLAKVADKFEQDLGPDHYDTLVAKTNLAWVYFRQSRLGEAEVIQREILEVGRSVLGSRHLYTLYIMLRLALTLGESTRYKEAVTLLDECIEGRKAALWDVHPAVAGADVWRMVFVTRMKGFDYSAGLSQAQVEVLKKGMGMAEYSYTPVLD